MFRFILLKLIAVAIALCVSVSVADPVRFMQTIEDLPLMPGLDENAASGVNFDSPGGRIIEIYAVGRVTAAEVVAFYQEVLPQLGWRGNSGELYIRDAESLRIEAISADPGGPLSVRFRVQPVKP